MKVVGLEAGVVQLALLQPPAQQAVCPIEHASAGADQQSYSARLVPPSQRLRSSFPVPELVGGSSSSSKLPC
jgi:hypothetical protein